MAEILKDSRQGQAILFREKLLFGGALCRQRFIAIEQPGEEPCRFLLWIHRGPLSYRFRRRYLRRPLGGSRLRRCRRNCCHLAWGLYWRLF